MDVTALEVLAYAVLIAVGVVQSFEDIDTHRVPVRTTQITGTLVVGLLTAASLVQSEIAALIRMLLCACFLWGVLALLNLFTQDGIGRGDLRLAPVIGAATGYLSVESFALGLLVIAVTGFLFGLIELFRVGSQARVPFVPVLYMGVVASVIVHG